MAGARLKFDGGYLGFERCEDPKTGRQYLRAVIFNASTGRTSSAPVELRDVMSFAEEAAGHCRNWGQTLAYNFADTLLAEFASRGFVISGGDALEQFERDEK